MIKHVLVRGLNHNLDVNITFNKDINILTGKNGSGKTTLLKLVWYLVSSNIERIIPEISFDYVEIETDTFYLSIEKSQQEEDTTYKFKWNIGDGGKEKELKKVEYDRTDFAEVLNRETLAVSKSSIFFPTFRRIEGGFSIQPSIPQRIARLRERPNPLQQAMNELSGDLSVFQHKFVSSISTNDIVQLLTQQYADVSQKTNSLHSELSEFITQRINEYSSIGKSSESDDIVKARNILHDIQERVNGISRQREELLKPFSVLSELVGDVFQHKGIKITEGITLGETVDAITSDRLSSGEKQMLSFLCYNAFSKESVLIIDEPELSLHVDWQRLLFPTLLQQHTNNQFIVATHSPFIYTKFPDKEIIIDKDRGE